MDQCSDDRTLSLSHHDYVLVRDHLFSSAKGRSLLYPPSPSPKILIRIPSFNESFLYAFDRNKERMGSFLQLSGGSGRMISEKGATLVTGQELPGTGRGERGPQNLEQCHKSPVKETRVKDM